MSVSVRHAPDASRYEIWVDDELAGFSIYERHGHLLAFLHTETLPQFSGRGLARQLVAGALDDVRANGRLILPFCPFVQRLVVADPTYQDLVPAEHRTRFGLPAVPAADR